jgi:hypothetical protein
VHLLRPGRIRPGRRLVAGRELKRQPGRGVVCRHDHEIVAAVGDRLAEQSGVEGGERQRVGAVDDQVVQSSDHAGHAARPAGYLQQLLDGTSCMTRSVASGHAGAVTAF